MASIIAALFPVRTLVVVNDLWELDYLSVGVRVNQLCADNYTVVVAFGT